MGISIRNLVAPPKALDTSIALSKAVTPIVVDLAEAPSKATIVRNGKEVATPTIDPARASACG